MTPGWWHRAADRAVTYGRDVVASLAVGSVLASAVQVLNQLVTGFALDPSFPFLAGFFGTSAVLAFWLGSPGRFHAELGRLKQLREADLISDALYQRLVERVAAWYAARRFGGPLPDAVAPSRTVTPRRSTPSVPKPTDSRSKPDVGPTG